MKKCTILLLLLAMSTFGLAQTEICGNGIDDDGDGFVDCFDAECQGQDECEGFYVLPPSLCQVPPPVNPDFSITLDFASPNRTTDHVARMAIGDMNNDGIPEIVSQSRIYDQLFILNGQNGEVIRSTTIAGDFGPFWRLAIANVEGDNCAEIFMVERNRNTYRITAWDCELNRIWVSEEFPDNPGHLGLADFDGDGLVELYYKDEVRDAATGTVIVAAADPDRWNSINSGPLAIDMEGDQNLELISGDKIFNVNLGSRIANSGSLSLLSQMPGGYKVKSNGFDGNSSANSIADYNEDGFLDVIVSGADRNDTTTVFFWDVQNNVVEDFSDPIPRVPIDQACGFVDNDQVYSKGWIRGNGRMNIGDLDGDGKLNVSFVSGRFLYALDENFDLLWRVNVNEETSGYTGCTLFDFNGDGRTEVVYRDEQWLYIINGTNGAILSQTKCISRTSVEYPMVADVDADGSTELCVLCATDDNTSVADFCDGSKFGEAQVRIYKSASEPWVPARRVWNQHGYFNVNVNDDLTIPRQQQLHHLPFTSSRITCDVTSLPNNPRPLNNFLNQSPFIDSLGCPIFASPDLAFVEGSLSANQPSCPDRDFTVSFRLTNRGDAALSGNIPVSFYNGDPTIAGATLLGTSVLNITNLDPQDIFTANNITISGPGSSFRLFIVLNDDGTVPTPVSFDDPPFPDCDPSNNIVSLNIIPVPFTIQTAKTDNITCDDAAIDPTGSARAFRLLAGVEETADYIFNWYNGTDTTGAPDFQGPIYTGLADGVYTVYADHISGLCGSDTAQVIINEVSSIFSIGGNIDPNTTCAVNNGEITVSIDGGRPVGDFTYRWFRQGEVETGDLLGTSHILSGLPGGTFVVTVTEKSTGCPIGMPFTVPDEANIPMVNTSKIDPDCTDETGSVSASVVGEGTAGFTFKWYDGISIKPTPDFEGITYDNLSGGSYTVVAERNSTKCASVPVVVQLNTQPPTVTIDNLIKRDVTACDLTMPNGSATVSVSGASTFTIAWYRGANTLPANLIAGETNATITGLEAGTYTVEITQNAKCKISRDVTLINAPMAPVLEATPSDVTTCNPFDGSVDASIVGLTDFSDYEFTWYNGPAVNASEIIAGVTGNELTGLEQGTYTVMAVNTTTGCETNAITVTVNAPVLNISLNDGATVFPSECVGDSANAGDGELTVNVAPATSLYNIDWYDGAVDPDLAGSPVFSQTNVTSSTRTNLKGGSYTVRATNVTTGCTETAIFNLPQVNQPEIDLLNIDNATTCNNDNGSIEVELSIDNGSGVVTASDYGLQLYEGIGSGGALLQSITGVINHTFPNLGKGEYTVLVISVNPAVEICDGLFVLAEIEQVVEYPSVRPTTLNANTNCTGATENGSITIEVNGGSDPIANFDIDWFIGDDTSGTPLPVGNITNPAAPTEVVNLAPGKYTVSVNDIVTFENCAVERTFTVVDSPPTVGLSSADIAVMPFTSCASSDGQAEVTQITEDGAAGNLADYNFLWFDASTNPIVDPNPGTPTILENLDTGTYFVRAIHNSNSCLTEELVQFRIEDSTIGTVGVNLLEFINPTLCLTPNEQTGLLRVAGIGNPDSLYTYEWFNESSNILVDPALDNDSIFDPLVADEEYRIRVTNLRNGCSIVDTLELELNQLTIIATANSTPVTNCVGGDNGTVFATVSSGIDGVILDPDSYDYEWTLDGAFIGNTALVSDLSASAIPYIVTVTDNRPGKDVSCSAQAQVIIEEQKILPVISVEAINPRTTCDGGSPDGVARANTNLGVVGFTFTWFEGTDVSGTPIYEGAEITGLTEGIYTVVAVNNISGCQDTGTIEIEKDEVPTLTPGIEALSNDTDCIGENGALKAVIDDNTFDYRFDWYNGEDTNGSPDYIGQIYNGLSAGTYTVVATNLITGCVSQTSEDILNQELGPEFEFLIQEANCGLDNGFASIAITNDVNVERIEWFAFPKIENCKDHDFSTGIIILIEDPKTGELMDSLRGPSLSNVPGGCYGVRVTTDQGCFIEEVFEIESEINPYNGVSRNGDGQNDIFKIDCIEDFPDNIVKIFNRNGTLVFEEEGYDNSSIFFDGVSNKGMRITGTNLPDGTYYYVIDKRDGSDPVAGYLEVIK